jgi:hypothetical protein
MFIGILMLVWRLLVMLLSLTTLFPATFEVFVLFLVFFCQNIFRFSAGCQ